MKIEPTHSLCQDAEGRRKVAPPPTQGRVACQAGRLSLFSAAQLSWEEAQSLMNGKLTRQGVHSGRELKPIRSKFFNRLAHSTWSGVLANITELLNSGNGTVSLSSGCLGTRKNARAAHTIRPLPYANKRPSLPGASGVKSARDQPWASPQPQARAFVLLSKAAFRQERERKLRWPERARKTQERASFALEPNLIEGGQ